MYISSSDQTISFRTLSLLSQQGDETTPPCAHRATLIFLNDPSELAFFSLQGAAWSILECVRRTSTF